MAQAKKRIEEKKDGSKTLKGIDLRPLAQVVMLEALRAGGMDEAALAARVDREASRRAKARAARREARAAADRLAAEAANDQRPLTAGQAGHLAEAEALDARAEAIRLAARKADRRMTSDERREMVSLRGQALAIRSAIERLRALDDENRAALRRLRETEALEVERGGAGAVERLKGQWGVRVRNRDGLKLLHEREAFVPRDADGAKVAGMAARLVSDRLMAVGLQYRDRFEMAQASLKSCLDVSDGARPAKVTIWAAARAAQARAARANRVREWERLAAVSAGPDAVMVLRAVAGEGRTITSLDKRRLQRRRLTDLLIAALTAIANRPLDGRD